jgi:hypothetical protein
VRGGRVGHRDGHPGRRSGHGVSRWQWGAPAAPAVSAQRWPLWCGRANVSLSAGNRRRSRGTVRSPEGARSCRSGH